jgi:hypothetical protein
MHKGAFRCADLGKGQRKSGLVVFDVSPTAPTGARIQVKNFWDDEPYGFWPL